MVRRRIVILTAVSLEARAIARAWGLGGPRPGKPVRTDDAATMIELHLVGIRAIRMPKDLHQPPVSSIIMAGLAGALDPTLRIADIVIDDCPPAYIPTIIYRPGRIITAPWIVSTPADKATLFRDTGALAVDMESSTARAAATELGVPFISLRAISDTAAEALDPAVLKLVNPFGRPRPLAIAGALLRRPSLIPELRQLGENAKLAAANLAAAVVALVHRINEVETGPRHP